MANGNQDRTVPAADAEELKPAKIRAARLDGRGVYQGMDEFDALEDLTARHIPEVTDCDLPPGKYRWNAQMKTFDALERSSIRPAPDVPAIEDVIYELAAALGERVPDNVVRWMDWYEGKPR